jgi:hypothetical protein
MRCFDFNVDCIVSLFVAVANQCVFHSYEFDSAYAYHLYLTKLKIHLTAILDYFLYTCKCIFKSSKNS